MTQHQRVTFERGREVVEHAIRHLSKVRDELDELHAQDHPERLRMLLDAVALEQRNLLGALQRWLDDAEGGSQGRALETYAQFTVALPGEIEPPESPLTGLGLIQWLARQNGYLQRTFAELADTGGNADAARLFWGIAEQVDAHERKLSKEYQRTEDL